MATTPGGAAGTPLDGQHADPPAALPPDLNGLEGLDIRAIDHVGVAVPDLAEALAFYVGVLGMRLVHEETNPEQGVHEAMLAMPEGSAQLQVIAPTGPDSPIARFLERSGPGLQQLACRVDDIVAAGSALRARGLQVLYDEARRGTAGSLINFVHPKDTGGVLLELVQPAGGSAR